MLLALEVGQKGLGREPCGDDKALRVQLEGPALCASLDKQLPASVGDVLGAVDRAVVPDLVRHVEALCVPGQVRMDDTARDVLAPLDAVVLGGQREVRILVGPDKVVGLEAGVESLFRPDAADRGVVVKDGDAPLWVELVVGLCARETGPAWSSVSACRHNTLKGRLQKTYLPR